MATFGGSVLNSSDIVNDYVCGACESKNIDESADYFCGTCTKFFCGKCIRHHDQLYANHSKYGRGEPKKWPLAKKTEDLLLKCDVHNNKKIKMFCQDHSQLCCSDCVLLNHRQCANVALISESVKKLSLDMQQLSNNLQTILNDLCKFKSTQEASIQTVEVSYSDKLQDIRDMRQKLNAALDKLENATLKDLGEYRAALQTSLKKDIYNCSRLKDELQQLSEAVQDLVEMSKHDLEFIASRKCLHKIQESETFLKENPMKAQKTMIFQADIDLEKYLYTKSSLGLIVDSMQSPTLNLNPDQVMTVKRRSEYKVSISSDKSQSYCIEGICSLPNDQVIVLDSNNKRVKLLNQHYAVTSHCDVSGTLEDICQITSSEVAVTVQSGVVQFISVINGQLVNGRKFQLQHSATGIAHHQGALYITSRNALYHYNMTGKLVKKLYEDTGGITAVGKCAVSPAGDRIYVTNYDQHKLLTLTTDGNLISSFADPELKEPYGVHITPAGQVLVCGYTSGTVIQVDHDGKKNLATLLSQKDGLPLSVCFNSNKNSIILGLTNGKIIAMELH
ncbi:uncharacterized protein LOC127868186 isoform X1 [Dreissena polymorpha]|uniref:uncharacterized protein LOC127868186 isoform X1 n=1 Tax=Dreissena polymorpha TaxID=45954 RepID=UPI002263C58D|nr:uncharacterized protein LOC127868186 isoform X1 [Dreissena polymorpha]